MATKDYIPRNLTAFAAWILNFYTQAQTLAAKYGIPPAQLQSLKKDTGLGAVLGGSTDERDAAGKTTDRLYR